MSIVHTKRRGLLLMALATPQVVTACSPGYVLRAGWEEARILAERRPIDEVVHDTTAPAEVRAKLRLVRDGRDFAERTIGLDAGRTFRSYVELSRDTLVLTVSAALEFRLQWHTWWFPIVGRVPYRGFFDFGQALAEADRLAGQGFDVSVRPVSAFSTLGWLPDPVLSTTLRMDSVSLIETIIHETTHTTFFPPGQAHFNESFANFVGNRGAIDFFCDALRDRALCEAARLRWEDTRVFGRFFHSVEGPLRELYALDLGPEEMRRRKRQVFEDAARRFDADVKPNLAAGRYGSLDPESLNNAWILSRLLYYTRLDDFEALFQHYGDLVTTFQAIVEETGSGDPWLALDRLLEADRTRGGGASGGVGAPGGADGATPE
jgi:predicted aminopeptidase